MKIIIELYANMDCVPQYLDEGLKRMSTYHIRMCPHQEPRDGRTGLP